MRETHTGHVLEVRTLPDPTTGSVTPFPVDKRRPMQLGNRSRTDSRSARPLCTAESFLASTEQCLTYAEVFATLGDMHNLYENTHSGSVTCQKHLGCEASAAFQAKPNAKSVKTSFGTIRKMTETERTEWLEMVSSMWASGCESCR